MKRDNVMRIAKDSGLRFHISGGPTTEIEFVSGHAHELEHFAAIIEKRTREDERKTCGRAIEFGEYLSNGVEYLLDAINGTVDEEGEPLEGDELAHAEQTLGDAIADVRSDIYEFRKRVARARSETGGGE